jgi:hypothetical protein
MQNPRNNFHKIHRMNDDKLRINMVLYFCVSANVQIYLANSKQINIKNHLTIHFPQHLPSKMPTFPLPSQYITEKVTTIAITFLVAGKCDKRYATAYANI